jgi:hypothetical protein
MNGRRVSRNLMILSGVLAVVSLGGVITTAVIGAAADKYGSYGEVPVPGFGVVHLPAGESIVSFHVGGYGGNGLRVPRLNFDITPPPGAPDPTVTEDLGATVSVNDDAHRRVWFMRVPVEGGYQILTSGEVGGYVEPRLAFGRTRSVEGPLWVFAALAMVTTDLAIAAWWFGRRGRDTGSESAPTDPYVLTDEGVRLEQLKTLSALRDSGALTQREFEAEKQRILDGGEGV